MKKTAFMAHSFEGGEVVKNVVNRGINNYDGY